MASRIGRMFEGARKALANMFKLGGKEHQYVPPPPTTRVVESSAPSVVKTETKSKAERRELRGFVRLGSGRWVSKFDAKLILASAERGFQTLLKGARRENRRRQKLGLPLKTEPTFNPDTLVGL